MALSAPITMKTVDGTVEVPTVGFGTWAFGDTGWCYRAVLEALKAGYRHLDCAWNYGTDDQVGAAVRDSGIPRQEIFITSKFWPNWGAPENVEKCLEVCLKRMQLEYLDLYLAHWPLVLEAQPDLSDAKATPNATDVERGIAIGDDGRALIDWQHTCRSMSKAHGKSGSFTKTWEAMQRLVTLGKVRAIGVSNFNIQQLEEALSVGGSVPLSCNQVEAHPWFQNTELLDFMDRHHILKAVYCPFAGQKKGSTLLEDPEVQGLAKKNDMGVGQLLLSWAVQRGTIPIGKSQTPDRIKSNLAIRKLDEADFEAVNALDKAEGGRTVDMGPVWGVSFY